MGKALAKLDELTNTYSIIKPPDDEIRGLNYYRDELEVQLKRFDAFKLKMNATIEKSKQQGYLLEFRKMLSGHCITHNRTVTIIQCTTIIKNGHCKFNEECKIRKNILEYIEL